MRALVTGASGFLGSHLVDALVAQGAEVRCATRRAGRALHEGKSVSAVEIDYFSPDSLDRALDGITHVFHVAGVIQAPDRGEFWRGNWLVTKSLVQAARRARGLERFLHVSSLAVSGPSPDAAPVTETTPCRPVSIYGRSKLRAEMEVTWVRDRLPVTVVRPPVIFGPRDLAFLTLARLLQSGFAPRIVGRRRLSFVSVRDVVRALLRVAAAPEAAGQTYFVADERYVPLTEFIEAWALAVGRRPRWIHLPPGAIAAAMAGLEILLRPLGWAGMVNRDKAQEMIHPHWICSPRKYQDRFGPVASISLLEGLAETVHWYRSHRLL